MLDLLTDPQRGQVDGPLRLSPWDAWRLDMLDTGAGRAGLQSAWQWQGDAGLRTLAKRLQQAGAPQPVQPPAGLGITLRPYQLKAWPGCNTCASRAWRHPGRRHGPGQDGAGPGPHLLPRSRPAGWIDPPALVVVPTSLLFNWQAEAARMAPGLRGADLHGPAAPRVDDMAGADVVLTTFNAALARHAQALAAQPFHLLILDEAQASRTPPAAPPARCAASRRATACASPARRWKTTSANSGRSSTS
jgi:hypothetical protein